MSYAHLILDEGSKVEILYQEGYETIHNAQLISRHRTAIYRELKRCPANQYQAQNTQEVANQRARHKG